MENLLSYVLGHCDDLQGDYSTKLKERKNMNELKIFENEEFGEIRTVSIDSEPWFVGKDIAEALGYVKARNAIATHVEEDDKKDAPIQGDLGGIQSMTVINESGLYSLILGSKLESAKRFKHWVTSEVLPSIRQNGGYIAGQENLSDEELMAKALLVAQNTIDKKNELIAMQDSRIQGMIPKEIFADAVSASQTSILVGDLAKLICQNGVQIGQRRLFEWLRQNGYLIKRKGSDWNMPTQRSMESKLFEIKESTHLDGNGCNVTTKTPKVTGKGQVYFVNKFIQQGA